jgi:transposase
LEGWQALDRWAVLGAPPSRPTSSECAVALLVSSGRPLSRIASELGLSPSMLRNWRNGSATDPAAELSRLRRENDRLRTERDILKKAVAI